MAENNVFIAPMEIDHTAQTPIYMQIVKLFKQKVHLGVLQVGDGIPPEMQLCRELNVSRTTVRQALSYLEDEGWLLRRRGKGTVVAEPKFCRNLDNLYNFSSEMRMLGFVPSSKIVSFSLITPPARVAELLQVQDDTLCFEIQRLRLADGVPLHLETAYIPQRFCPTLSMEDLTSSLYEMISNSTGSPPAEAVESYDAITLKEKQAALLECRVGSAAFLIERVSKNTQGEVFEVSHIIAPGSRNRYQISLHRSHVSMSRIK